TVGHPLVRQAAAHPDLSQAKYCALVASTDKVEPGSYPFALYRWSKHGIKPDESLIAVSDQSQLEAALFELFRSASGGADAGSLPDSGTCDALDARHYAKWSEAQANHMAQNR